MSKDPNSKDPDLKVRLGDLRESYEKEAMADGFKHVGTWMKWVINRYVMGKNKPKE